MLSVIVKKELKRVFSDRRLIFSAFFLPALSIFVLYTLMGVMFNNRVDDIEEHKSIVYIQNSPKDFDEYYRTVEHVINMSVEFIDKQQEVNNIKDQIRNGNIDLLIYFEDNFENKINNYTQVDLPPQIKTYYNPSQDYSYKARSRFIGEVLEGYKNSILKNRFGNLNHIIAFDVDRDNADSVVMDEKKATGQGVSMILPMLIGILLFAGAMGIGMDTIAGEKERGTMATLLIMPIKRESIAIGKVIGLGIVAIISAVTSFGAILASMPFASSVLTGSSNVDLGALSFSFLQYIQLLLIMVTLVGIYVGLICLLSVKARSVKEAGTYVTPVYMLVMIASFSTMFSGAAVETYKYAIPVYGSISALKGIFTFELTMQQFLVTVISSFFITVILIRAITKTFNNEKVMLNA